VHARRTTRRPSRNFIGISWPSRLAVKAPVLDGFLPAPLSSSSSPFFFFLPPLSSSSSSPFFFFFLLPLSSSSSSSPLFFFFFPLSSSSLDADSLLGAGRSPRGTARAIMRNREQRE